MVKKLDWKYTIAKNYLDDVKDLYDKFLDRFVELYKDSIDKDQKIELTDKSYFSIDIRIIYELMNEINNEEDIKDFKEIADFINDNHSDFMRISNFKNNSKTLDSIYNMIANYNDFYKEPEKILEIKKLIGSNSLEYINNLDREDLINLIVDKRFGNTEFFKDIELKRLVNSFRGYSLHDNILKNSLLGSISKGVFSKSTKVYFNHLIDENNNLDIVRIPNLRIDDEELKNISDDMIEIYQSYQFLLNELKVKNVKNFNEFIKEKLPNLKVEEFEISSKDLLTEEKIKKEYPSLDKDLRKIDNIIKKMELV
ncbi:hypothetical protein UFVDC4_00120 [Staphylococcus phage vB_SauM-UFV_DC4]|nr:hypothetical protein UFVDC4_00120 [Staphylococcus phage vB_SauM-UFV_DC4]